ncbi:SGNH/GDSL hydrolase family protein [Parapedobacter sp. 2B3]|uniref:SGNH/GDSL hydrolase family protein n=1 Tax=Parapedobacter sp. 2B3 TaxID=3342381 RepID=UPI0035B665B1
MNVVKLASIIGFLGCWLPVLGQLKYHSVESLPLFGKMTDQTETRYERLPAALKTQSREPVWGLGKNTAGLYLRFRSNTTAMGLKWTLYQNRMMNHMTETGIKGFDLYCLDEGKWVFVNSARPQVNSLTNEARIVANMDTTFKEFMLYFPLYDGVVDLQLGADSSATIAPPLAGLPVADKPVVCYGTSIQQGGCASRPGMAHLNILSRRFNREFVNLGFSGNAKLDYEIAELIGHREASLIVLDFMPNVGVELIEERLEKFYRIVRQKAPHTTILFVENPLYPQAAFDRRVRQTIADKNAALHTVFHRLIASGEQHIHIVPALGMLGTDNEATVDGVHFTDLGFMRYANHLYPYIEQYMNH